MSFESYNFSKNAGNDPEDDSGKNAGNDPEGIITDFLRKDISSVLSGGNSDDLDDDTDDDAKDYEYYYENWKYLDKIEDIRNIIDNMKVKDDCPNKEQAQEKLDYWKTTIYEELEKLENSTVKYCCSIDNFNQGWSDSRSKIIEELVMADEARRNWHNTLINNLCIVVKHIKLNFFSPDKTAFIKATGLNPNAFLDSSEINKVEPIEFVPKEFYVNGGMFLSPVLLKQSGLRTMVTDYARILYNEFKEKDRAKKSE